MSMVHNANSACCGMMVYTKSREKTEHSYVIKIFEICLHIYHTIYFSILQ